ncbi:ABC transporter permease [Actinacidiphila bryophytorum]|uniref:ABC transporter permease n=1 Tax=Actinacidiphila bryophytorum TaxID=1436133 RepID=UPI002176E99E|nr:ABC transporter permease [Actinacidiphila bryophytorum]UWE08363.1 ABC transporter permease [Actinacidiphila bryophytorum]
MVRFLLRRSVNYLVLVFLAATMTYFIAASALEPIVNYLQKHPQPPTSTIHNLLRAQNLDPDTPLAIRYWRWLTGVLHGDFGTTYTGDSVRAEMGRRVYVSTELLLLATVVSAVTGVAFGAWNALRQYRPSDRASTVLSYGILATPSVVIAVSLQTIDNKLGSPVQYTGMYDPNAHGTVEVVLSNLQHLILPTITLWLVQMTLFSRFQRSTMLDVLGADFLRTARAKGLTRRQVVLRHGLRTAVIPVMPLLVYTIILLFTGATFTETIFAWHGMGEWLISSIQNNDVNATAAIGVFTAGLVLVAGLVSDLVYAALDPRVRS